MSDLSPCWLADNQESGDHAVGLAVSEVRGIVERVFAQQDVLDACARRDLGAVITILGAHGVTQGQIAELTSISQGRLSEWATHKRAPAASSTFEAFADGLGIELLHVFRTGFLRLFHAAACIFRNSSMTSCGVRYPSPEWRRVRLQRSSIHRAISAIAFRRVE